MEMSKEMQEQFAQFRNFNQKYQFVVAQRQGLDMRTKEIEGSLKELELAKGKAYIAAGSILVEGTKEDIKTKLTKQQEEISSRVEVLKKQEEKLRKKLEDIQAKIQEKGKKEEGAA